MKSLVSVSAFCLLSLFSVLALAGPREAACLTEAELSSEDILKTANETMNHLKTARSPFAVWQALDAKPFDPAAAKQAVTEQNITIELAATSLLKVIAYHQCLTLDPIAQFAGSFPMALESWFNVQRFDRAREASLQVKYRAPNPVDEQAVVRRLTPIASQLISSGFAQMCRDPRTDAFFSRCLMIQFKSDSDYATAQPLLESIERDYRNVVLFATPVIRVR